MQGYRPRRERGRRQLLRSRQQAREDPDAVQHAPLHRKVSTLLTSGLRARVKDVRSWIFVSKLRYFFFYERTRETLRFDKLFADFYARRGSRSLQKSSSIRGSSECLDFYSFLFHGHR